MDRPRILRLLRIAFSAVCGIVCLLLIALWLRSYWRVYSLYEQHYDAPSAPTTYVRSWVELQKGNVVISKGFKDAPMRPRSGTFQWDIVSQAQSYVRPEGVPFWGFEYSSNNERMNLAVPCWIPVLLLALVAATPWLSWLTWRFSLRTLLIATTFVAVVLGLAVAFR
jgi:hypothetical protein